MFFFFLFNLSFGESLNLYIDMIYIVDEHATLRTKNIYIYIYTYIYIYIIFILILFF